MRPSKRSFVLMLAAVWISTWPLYSQDQPVVYILQNSINEWYYYINRSGKFLYRSVDDFPFAEGLAAVSNIGERGGRIGYIDTTGKMIIEVDGLRLRNFSEGLAAFKNPSGLWGYINRQGQVVIKPQYPDAHPFVNGFARVMINNKYGYIDRTSRLVIKNQYSGAVDFHEGIAGVCIRKGGTYGGTSLFGFIDASGNRITAIEFNEISRFLNGFAWAGKRDIKGNYRFALINNKGKPLTEFKYNIRKFTPEPPDFTNGALWTELLNPDFSFDGVLLDSNGKELKIVRGLRNLYISDGPLHLAQREDNGRYFYIDRMGEIPFPKTYVSATEFHNGLAVVREEAEGKAGLIDSSGQYVFQSDYTNIGEFSEGSAPAEKNGKWGYIDRNGKVLIDFKFESATPFSEGIARVSMGGKWGYIGKNGVYIIKPQFEAAEDFRNGIARVGNYPADATVSDWEYWKYIDREGHVFWEPENRIPESGTVVLPEDYDPAKKYQVLIMLPFTGGFSKSLFDSYFKSASNQRQSDSARHTKTNVKSISSGKAVNRDLIILITAGSGSYRDHSWRGFERAIERYNNSIQEDLNELAGTYNIDTSRIFLAGFSLGGDLSWALLNKNAGQFKGAIIMGSRCSYSKKGSMEKLAAMKARVFITMGEFEEDVRIKGAKYAKTIMDKAGIANEYITLPKIGHGTAPDSVFVRALDFLIR